MGCGVVLCHPPLIIKQPATCILQSLPQPDHHHSLPTQSINKLNRTPLHRAVKRPITSMCLEHPRFYFIGFDVIPLLDLFLLDRFVFVGTLDG